MDGQGRPCPYAKIHFFVIDFVAAKGKTQQILVQVKSGKVKSGDIRDLVGVIDREREKAAQGVFITLEPPTRDMILEATKAGHYHSDLWNRSYPRLQIITIEELLAGKALDIPMPYSMFKQSAPVKQSDKQQLELFE